MLAAAGPVRMETPALVARIAAAARSTPAAGVGSVPDPVPRPLA
jgi:hypothetical protein